MSLILPGVVEADREVFGHCHVCGAVFHRGGEAAWERHVGRCARSHIDEIRAKGQEVRQRAGAVFDPDNWDREYDDHMLGVGRKMLKEGRLVARPNER